MWSTSKKLGSFLLLFLVFCAGAYTQESPPPTQSEDIEQLKQNLLALEKRYQVMKVLLDSSNSTIASLQQSVLDGQNEIKSLETSIKSLQQEIEDKRKSLEALQEQLLASKVDSALLTQQLQSWEKTIQTLQQNLQEVQSLFSKALLSFNDYKQAVDKQLNNIKAQRNILFWVAVIEAVPIIGVVIYFIVGL